MLPRELERKEPEVARYEVHPENTAIRRKNLSRPVRLAMSLGFLQPWSSFLDYGCGLGDDHRLVHPCVFSSMAYDPLFKPGLKPAYADVVNLGYVLNVIEEKAERIRVLKNAFMCTKRVLIVTVRTEKIAGIPYKDGVYVKARKTFQKSFTEKEIYRLIKRTLGREPIRVENGLYLVFSDSTAHLRFVDRMLEVR